MPLLACEQYKLAAPISAALSFREEDISSYHEGRGIRCRTALRRNPPGVWTLESEETSKGFRRCLLDDCEDWGDVIDIDVCIEDGEKKIRYDANLERVSMKPSIAERVKGAHRISGRAKFIHETLVPRVD